MENERIVFGRTIALSTGVKPNGEWGSPVVAGQYTDLTTQADLPWFREILETKIGLTPVQQGPLVRYQHADIGDLTYIWLNEATNELKYSEGVRLPDKTLTPFAGEVVGNVPNNALDDVLEVATKIKNNLISSAS